MKPSALTTATAGVLAAAALTCSPGAHAQSAPSIYGLLDISAGRFQPAGADKTWQAASGQMTTSYLGFRGSEDLGGGLKTKFALESYLALDTGTAGRFSGNGSSLSFWARNAYVGFEGAFGSTVLGRNMTPLFNSTVRFNAFGDSFGFSPSVRQLFTPSSGLPFLGDTSWSNSISYASPQSDNGLSFNLLGNVSEGAAGATGKNVGASLFYASGPLAATLAYQQVRNGDVAPPPGWQHQQTYQAGASYDLNVAKVFGQYTLVKTQATIDTRAKLYSFGVAVPIGLGRVLAQYGNTDADFGTGAGTTSNKTLSLGYDYFLSKHTDVYAVYMNDRTTGLSTGNTFAGGLRLRF